MRHRRILGSRGLVAVGLLALAILISGSPFARPAAQLIEIYADLATYTETWKRAIRHQVGHRSF